MACKPVVQTGPKLGSFGLQLRVCVITWPVRSGHVCKPQIKYAEELFQIQPTDQEGTLARLP
jgi:hypothetical protein